jgi:NAD(P)-dependent dehydrogenase (short-subunit alcohol dehydrogenase family)
VINNIERRELNLPFADKVALVTGGASGIGLATAKAFAQAGAAVTLADVKEDAVRSAVEELVAAGHNAIPVTCDVANEPEVAAMIEQTVSAFGRLDAPSTMRACSLLLWEPLTPAAKNLIA